MVLRASAALLLLLLQYVIITRAAELNRSSTESTEDSRGVHRGIHNHRHRHHRNHRRHRSQQREEDIEIDAVAKASLLQPAEDDQERGESEEDFSSWLKETAGVTEIDETQAKEELAEYVEDGTQLEDSYQDNQIESGLAADSKYDNPLETAASSQKLLRSEVRGSGEVERAQTRSNTFNVEEDSEGSSDALDEEHAQKDDQIKRVQVLATRIESLEKAQQEQKMRALQHEIDELRHEQLQKAEPVTTSVSLSTDTTTPAAKSKATTAVPSKSPSPPSSVSDSTRGTSTETDAGTGTQKTSSGFPGWAIVLLASASAGIAVIATTKLGDCVGGPKEEAVPSEATQVQTELERVRQRTRELEQTLEAHKAAAQAAARRAAGLPPLAAPASSSTSPADGTPMALDANAPLLAKAEHMKHAVTSGIEQVKGRVATTILSESEALLAEVKVALNNESVPAWLTPSNLGGQGGEEFKKLLPMIGILLAGSVAPGRIRALRVSSNSQVTTNVIVLAIANGTGLIEWKTPCKDISLWVWLGGMAVISILALLLGGVIAWKCKSALVFLDDQVKLIKNSNTGVQLIDGFYNLRNSGTYFMKALFRYEKIVTSTSYHVTQLICILYMIWGAVGVYLSIAHVSIDARTCPARSVLVFMNVYSFFMCCFSRSHLSDSCFGLFKYWQQTETVW